MRISEIFYSIQGEGPFMGRPSVFIRLAGCNLRCQWCDTKYALDTSDSFELNSQQVLESLSEWLTNLDPNFGGNVDLVFTGGEPMLQQDAIVELFKHFENFTDQKERPFKPNGYLETNGTVPISNEEITKYISTAIISPKLENSGLEDYRYNKEVLQSYIDSFGRTVFKFVVEGQKDIQEIILNFWVALKVPSSDIWLMPEGATVEEYRANAKDIAELCKHYQFNYSARLHLDLWQGAKGT